MENVRGQSISGGTQRQELAQLCKGFLLLNDSDAERARAFLVTFLRETSTRGP